MLVLILMTVVFSAAVGLVVKFFLDRAENEYEITWMEYAITAAVITLLAAPGSIKLGWELAKKNKITYNEYWNGWESNAFIEIVKCERDGNCKYEYDCDPYIVPVAHQSCDSNNNCTTYYTYETRYHSCPYVEEELNYKISTTLEEYMISPHRFPLDPQAHRWRKGERIPERVISNAGVGEPPFWRAAKDRIDSGKPGPVTARREYKNYLYASDKTILKQYSGEIERFKKLNLLPRLQLGIYDFYNADKAYFVGYKPQDAKDWQKKVGLFNAAFGIGLQGDLHLVIVQDATINSNPDEYVIALKTHWQNPIEFGKNSFSKNGIAVIIGTTDGKNISWARAFTGMPIGNESMVTAIGSRLKNVSLSADVIVGEVHGVVSKVNVSSGKVQAGILGDIVYGFSESDSRFYRISMSGKQGKNKGTGFLYLMGEIQPTKNQKWIIFGCAFLACSLGWLIAVFVGTRKNYYGKWR